MNRCMPVPLQPESSQPPRLIIATRNAHKTAEIRDVVGDAFEVLDVTAFPDCPEIEETGTTTVFPPQSSG